ncbi:YjbH domain-containing protein [Ramlibacter sp. XY19]|uniref:YjbH domain-containing protein n=1 Tax=Ramlibacter paludis TaxID=2908000 RepID=UPI0023D9D460|nr:YjbH domain-containing protein [Ramlibacter paludis]MCG2592031.1 YjbH domain-containing protein [Ramlibacter paludis]
MNRPTPPAITLRCYLELQVARSGALALACLFPAFASGMDQTFTQGGFTGYGITPNAQLLGWGRMALGYDNQLAGYVRNPSGHNYVLGFGLLPNMEVSGRLAASSPQDANCFAVDCGARDLSASGKFGIGLDTAGRFRIAVGATDLGGSVTYFRSYYGVGTFSAGDWEVSGGVAKRSGAGVAGSRSPLDGPFAAAAWQPAAWVRGHVEYTDGNAWAGVRLFAPQAWLPEGWSGFLGANVRLTGTDLTEKSWVSAGISIPLYKVPALGGAANQPPPALRGVQQPLPAYEARAVPTPITTSAPPLPPQPGATNSRRVSDDRMRDLAAALRAAGLEDIWVGRMPDGSVAARANNATYNWNSLDAVGASLAAIARTLGDSPAGYRFILTQRQLPMVAITGQTDCLRMWIQTDAAGCAAGELSTPGTTALDLLQTDADWVVRRDAPSWQTLRVALSPVLRTNIGSEFGVLDYSVGANIGFLQPLWSGATVEARFDVPIANSSDYEEGAIFGRRRVVGGLERLAFTQVMRLPLERWLAPTDDVEVKRRGLAALTAQATIGRYGSYYDGIHGSLRWEPGDGRHRLSAEAGVFRNGDYGNPDTQGPRTARPFLASYRYHFQPTRTYLEATAGNFMRNDVGVQVGMRQWFGDVAVNLYYRHSKFENSPARQFLGLMVSVPIGPRRDMNPGGLQVTGTPRFSVGTESTLREKGGNTVRIGYGVTPPVPSLDAVFNSDRAGLAYFEDNLRRIRDAARQSPGSGALHD